MATSGSENFDLTRNEIITDALVIVNAIEHAESAPASDAAFAARALNRMVKAWQATGIHLWKTKEAVVFLTAGTASYSLASGGDHATLSHVKTELASDASSGASTITVDSITGISASDNIGVVQDDGTLHWTTVNGSPSGSTVTLTAVLTDDAAADNHVYAYTTRLNRPLRVRAARRRDDADNDTPMWMWSHDEYFQTPNKTAQAPVTAAYYDPQLTTGSLYLWPSPDTVNDRVFVTADVQIEDFDASTDNSDLPQEWLDCLVWNLADRLAITYAVPAPERREIAIRAASYYQAALGFDRETAPTQFVPDRDYG